MNCRGRPAEPVDLQEVQELYSMLFARMAGLDPYACRAGQQAALKIMQTPPYACLQPNRYCYIFDLAV